MKSTAVIIAIILALFLGCLYFTLYPDNLNNAYFRLFTYISPEEETAPAINNKLPFKVFTLTTQDDMKLSSKYYKAIKAETAKNSSVLLLHELGSDSSAWDNFAIMLKEMGYNVLTIDLRGHGNSEGVLENFEKTEFGNMVLDAKAGGDFLQSMNTGNKIAVIGAGLGANIAINYSVIYQPSAVIALSPSLDYNGITTDKTILSLKSPILILSSLDDPESSNSADILYIKLKNKDLSRNYTFKKAGRGTGMLGKEGADDILLEFLNANLQ